MSEKILEHNNEQIGRGNDGTAEARSKMIDDFLHHSDSPISRPGACTSGGALDDVNGLPKISLDCYRASGPEESSTYRDYDIEPLPQDQIAKTAESAASSLLKDENSFGKQEFQDMLIAAGKGGELSQFIDAVNKALKDKGSNFSLDYSESTQGGMGTSFTGPRYYPNMYHDIKVRLSDGGRLIDTTRASYGGQDPRIKF